MFIKTMEQSRRKALISLMLIPLFFFMLSAGPARPDSRSDPDYLVYPQAYPDNYILSELFYAAFHMDDLASIQKIVKQGLLAYPNDFPHFMALTLELAKKPDARLFMLLSPLAPQLSAPGLPADLGSVIELSELLSGKNGAPAAPSLRDRIQFYEDDAKVVRPRAQTAANSANSAGKPDVSQAGGGLTFTRAEGEEPRTELLWTKSLPGGHTLVREAKAAPLPNGGLWGSVRTAADASAHTAYFSIDNGIISFADPKGISEADFYADETARPHTLENPGSGDSTRRAAALRPCEMRLNISAAATANFEAEGENPPPGLSSGQDALPPELTLRLEQSNAGPESSDFLCRAQCVLSYSWEGQLYSLSGKACTQSGWGVWPYSDERFRESGF